MELLEDRRYTNQKKQAQCELEKLLPSTPLRVREAIFPQNGRRRPRVLLGCGSHGRVWKVSIPSGAQGLAHGDVNLPPAVAVKELGMETKELEATAKRELAVLRALCSSSSSSSSSCNCINLVRCWGAAIDPARNLVAVALELAAEGSLRSWLNRWREEQQHQYQQQGLAAPDDSSCEVALSAAPSLAGDLSVVAALAAHLVSGLKVLHAAGFCHGDLTPSNVLVLPWELSVENLYSASSSSSASKVASTSVAVPQPFPRPISVEALSGGPWRLVLSDFGLAAPTITTSNTKFDANTNITLKTDGTLRSSSAMKTSSIRGVSSDSTTITTPPSGMAAAVSPSLPRVPCGASRYCCPEAHISGCSGACPGDIWSLGVVLWEAAAFCHPFDLDDSPYENEGSSSSSNNNNTKAALATAAPLTPNASTDSASASVCLVPATTRTFSPPLPPVQADTTIDCGDQNLFAGEFMSSPSKPCNGLATKDNYWAISEAIEAVSVISQRNLGVVVAARHHSKVAMVQEKSDLSRVSSQVNGAGLSTESQVNEKDDERDEEIDLWKFVAGCLAFKAEQRPTAESAASAPFVLLGCDEVL